MCFQIWITQLRDLTKNSELLKHFNIFFANRKSKKPLKRYWKLCQVAQVVLKWIRAVMANL